MFEHEGSRIAIAIRNTDYLVDYLECGFTLDESQTPCFGICDSIVASLETYSRAYLEKIIGLAMPKEIDEKIPNLCSRLWADLDCIPLVLDQHQKSRQPMDRGNYATFRGWNEKSLDEQADSMARKCIKYV